MLVFMRKGSPLKLRGSHMADNFTAELVDSAGQIFATDQNTGDNAHYPIGKLAWGALNTFNITDTNSPFPVKVWGNGSSATIHVTTDSGNPPKVTLSDTVVSVTGYVAPSTNVTVSQAAGSSFQVTHAGLTALDSAINSSNELFVKVREIDSGWTGYDAGNSALRVSVVSGPDSGAPTFIENNSGNPIYVTGDSDAPVVVRPTTQQFQTQAVSGFGSSADNPTFVANDATTPLPISHSGNDTTRFIYVKSVGGLFITVPPGVHDVPDQCAFVCARRCRAGDSGLSHPKPRPS